MSIRRRIKVETRDRKDVLNEAIIPQSEFLERFLAKPLRFQWLFGAGMSASAGVPTAQMMIDEIIVKIFEKSNPGKRGQVTADDLKEWVSREKWFNPNYPYVSAIEKEYPSVVLRTELFKRYMRGRFPSPAQLIYAIGVKEGKLANRCYTTNWDTLTEDAFYWLRGTNCVTIKGPDQLREVKDFDHRYVVKIHGDLDRYDIRYLREGMAKHNDDLRDFLRQSLSNTGLVIMGYAGLEYSVMNMLMELVHDYPDVCNGGLFWGYMGNMKHIPEPITDLMAIGLDKGKEFRIFEAEDADFVFERIAKSLELTDIEDELAVAFFRFNKMGYGKLRQRQKGIQARLSDLVHRDLLDEGFLVRDYNAIHEVWRQDMKGFSKKKDERERSTRDAERKFINHCFNDLKHESYADAEVKFKDVMSHFPDNEMVYWGMGWARYSTGNYEDALNHFDEALKRNDKNVGTYIAKSMCYQALGQPRNELAMYSRVLEMKGDIDYIWYNNGLAAHALGDLQLERQSYESATAANPNSAMAWYNLGVAYAELGSALTAMRCFSRAKELSTKFIDAVYNNGILLGRIGQDMQGIRNFDSVIEQNQNDDEAFRSRGIAELMIGQNDRAAESYEEYMHSVPDDHESWANYGVALYGIQKFDEAMSYTERYLGHHPDDARVWYNKGMILYKQGDRPGAMKAFDKSLSLNDDYDMVWYRKALLMGELGQYEGEVELLTRFLNRNEQDLRGWFELGEANRKLAELTEDVPKQQRFYSAAVVAYDRALDIQRTDLPTWLQKAVVLNRLHRYEEALECVKYLVRYDKNNAEVFYQKGLAHDGLGDQLAAADTFAQVLKLAERHEGAYYRRGILLAELEQYAKAVEHFENVIDINPDRWQAYHFKGVCIVKQKEYDRALKVFEDAEKMFPGQPRFYIDEALAYVMRRDIDTARAKLREALSIDPSFKAEIEATPEFGGLI